ncbi:hypothetical protein PT974_07042 [Cladobotryum mycophilum]|uniref:Glucan 1, 4-alpha-glucosidase n=1 Tax=Cladobotryum mycophilum TaxID=491253 RepID=A0ABR0SND0_9HYPO
MEDPWGSPWAADTPAKLDDIPTAPQTAHFAAEHHTPRKISQNLSPKSPAWGRSPALKPLKDPGLAGQPSPDPWKGMGLDHLDTSKLEPVPRSRRGSERSSRDGRIVDSAISMGEEEGLKGDRELNETTPETQPTLVLNIDTQDAWAVEDVPKIQEKAVSPRFHLERSISGETLAGLESDLDHDGVVGVNEEAMTSPSPDAGSIHDTDDLEVEIPHAEEETKETPEDEVDVPAVPEIEVFQSDQIPIRPKPAAGHEPWAQEDQEVRAEPEVLEKRPSRAVQPSISYPINLTELDNLFPTTKPIHTEPEPVPDVIIDDSFTSSGERKAWYLVSRFGSMRKHNSGNDENYVRVGWAGSEVRDRTIKTVRRWMEEDSITGRVVLGRRHGASGASMFNWDSKAPQVEIGELLGRSGRHARHASLMSPVVSPTAVAFGWTGSSPSSPVVPKQRPMSMIQLATAPKSSLQSMKSPLSDAPRFSFEPPPSPKVASAPSPIPSPTKSSFVQASPIQLSSLSTINGAGEDDDDWGEMVGTPTVGDSGATPFSPDGPDFGATSMAAPLSLESIPKKSHYKKPIPSNINTALNPPSSAWDFGHLEDGWKSATSPKPLSPSFMSGHTSPAKSLDATPSPISTTLAPTTKKATEHRVTFAEPSTTIDEEDVVADILRNLPDLTYMLK